MTSVRHPATALRELSRCPSAAPRAGVPSPRGSPRLSEEHGAVRPCRSGMGGLLSPPLPAEPSESEGEG